MRRRLGLLLGLATIVFGGGFYVYQSEVLPFDTGTQARSDSSQKLGAKAKEAVRFAQAQGFDEQHVFLIDFSIHSGKPRFFVWDVVAQKVAFASLVAHGYGNEANRSTAADIVFSNVEGSYASSLGKYRVGARAYSQYGIHVHYKLHGLEASNDNAFKRVVVLHSYQKIPTEAIYPRHLRLGYSQGCPVIDDQAMAKVDKLMQGKTKPVLLWVYQSAQG